MVRDINSMLPQYKKKVISLLFLGSGILILLINIKPDVDAPGGNIWVILGSMGVFFFTWGCIVYAKAKGYPTFYGLVGLTWIYGLLLLMLLSDKTKNGRREQIKEEKFTVPNKFYSGVSHPTEALPWRGVFSTIQVRIIFVSFFVSFLMIGAYFFLGPEKPKDVDVVGLMGWLFGILILSWIGLILVIVAVNIPILLVRWTITVVRWTITAPVDFAKNTVDFAKKLKPNNILWIGVTLICLMGLFPPWTEKKYHYDGPVEERPAGYYFLLSGPRTFDTRIKYRLDFPRLIIPCLIVGIITGAGMWTLKDRDK